MRSDKNQHKSSQALIANVLKQRLSINNIYREFELITNMTRNLEIKFRIFAKLQPIKHLTKDKIIHIIKSIPFLSYSKIKERGEQQQWIRINYQNSNRVVLVTGITKEAIQDMIKQFNQSFHFSPNNGKTTYSRIIATNGFWTTIEANGEDSAAYLKKVLRNRKKSNDSQNIEGYKVQGKRIRIVILKEDFLSILIDAMTQLKSETFIKQFCLANPPAERRKSQDQTLNNTEIKKKSIIYKSILLNSYYSKSQIKDQEYSDGFSQSNSLSSDILDSNKIKDLIETSDQGIQSENNGEYISQNSESKEQEKEHNLQNIQQQNNPKAVETVENINDKQEGVIMKTETVNDQPQEPLENRSSSEPQKIEFISQELTQKQAGLTNLEVAYIRVSNKEEEKEPQFVNPYASTQVFAGLQNQSLLQTAIQTQQFVLSTIPFATMKKYFQEFKNSKNTNQLIELPAWAKSQTEQQRNRHRFFGSLCRRKIIQKPLAFS